MARTERIDDDMEQLEGALKIDEHRLDEANVRQADLFYRVAKQLALKISERDFSKTKLQELEAKVDGEIREDARDQKITEKDVESQKLQDQRVMSARRELTNLNNQVGVWSALKEAYTQRSYALGHLTDLYVGNYFAEAGPSRKASDFKDANSNRARNEMSNQRRQRL